MDIGGGNSVVEHESNQTQDWRFPEISSRPVLQRKMSTYGWRSHGEFVVRTAGENTAHSVEVPSLDSASSSKANRKTSSWDAAVDAGVQVPKLSTRGALEPMAGWNNMPFVQLLAQATSGYEMPSMNAAATMSRLAPVHNSHILRDRIWSGRADSPDNHTASSTPKEQNRKEDYNPPTPHGEPGIVYRQIYDLNSPPEIEAKDIFSRTSEFVPVTPDKSKKLGREHSPELPKPCPEENAQQEMNEASADMTSRTHCEEEHPCADSSSAAVTTPEKNHNAENDGTGLTTPQQKPRRRKHRPKVITEGKPKRMPKKETPKPSGALDNPTSKRKYVRRKGLSSLSTNPSTRTDGDNIHQPMDAPKRSSSKRSLNFELESQIRDGSSLSRLGGYVNTAEKVQRSRSDEIQSNITVHIGQGMEVPVTNSGSGMAYELTRSINQLKKDYISSPASVDPSNPAVTKSNIPEQSRETDLKIEDSVSGMDEETAVDKGQAMETLSCYDIHSVHQNYNASGSSLKMPMGGMKRSNKAHSQMINKEWPSTSSYTNEQYKSVQDHLEMQVDFMRFPEIFKKKRTERGQSPTTARTSSKTTARDTQRMAKHSLQYAAENNLIARPANGWNSTSQSNVTTPITGVSGVTKEVLQTMLTMGPARQTKKRSKGPIKVRDLSSLSGIARITCLPTSMASQPRLHDAQGVKIVSRPTTCMESLVSEMHMTLARGKRSKKRNTASNCVSSGANTEQLHEKNMQYKQLRFVSQSIVPPQEMIWEHLVAVDEIEDRLKQLDINQEGKLLYQEWSAIVPYNVRHQGHQASVSYDMRNQEPNELVVYGQKDTLVPYDGSSYHVKKRRPRAKVDLDDETHKVWKLLLENINNEGIDGTDEEKAKWWEEERRVFRGRADSFIARMHLVQGDRRFSQWKGSVVDSVIGVFLTQNVSDHLSSSAFMSLASHFPIKPKNSEEPSHEEVTDVLNTEPEVSILDPIETISWEEQISNNQVCRQMVMTNSAERNGEKVATNSSEIYDSSSEVLNSLETSNCRTASSSEVQIFLHPAENSSASKTSGTGTTCVVGGDKRTMEDVVSSQDSVVSYQSSPDSSYAQTTERIGLYSESISTESKCDSSGKSTSFVKLLQMAETPMFYGNLSSQSSHVQDDQILIEVQIKRTDLCDQQGQHMGTLGDPQSSLGFSAMQEGKNHFSDNHFNADGCSQDDKGNQHVVVQSPTRGVKDATESTSAPNSQKATEQAVITKSKKTKYTSDRAFYESNTVALKAKRRRVGRDFNHTFDWDSLRKQAQNIRKRERTATTMDSLDYEAMRHTDVSEIAETIKERGMNNMLAERMKDFLNRLVREHGSIDLEWLRDIPPDKAKEYLLSIRGLGLKSVECVRLLTLHHLAFPVDTNVGRIAVRLGWVPLQPLPESLQLHLLEMYPVMESIQKYLWPRLCKLDQRTLYELHYQMITFGKVFCTKNKPNCNACPMRGECRHFASAFASARLALPGPEEKSVVRRTESKASDHNAALMSNPLQLPPALTNQHVAVNNQLHINQEPEAQSTAINCEPIIEEPKTPEPEIIQLSESDIEDAGYEDPDEIPTINLNIEQFTQNLQNYMQKNMELQEGDVSKALVALTPEAASIPTPKLKNVSHLRTEHQVYELPDSHPLLDGLDKREPDDPCSYLLAIWTPGETANSIEPPEGNCCSREFGNLCDVNTCFTCNSTREANSQTVRGTLLIPCRTAMRGSFPLNGTYFQVNEVFADHASSLNPIDVPRNWLWNLPRRTVYFGTSIPTIFKGLSTQGIQYCFWRGFVCVRGFDQKTRAPRPLMARLHFPASKLSKSKGTTKNEHPLPH